MIAVFSTDQYSDLSEFLVKLSAAINEDNPRKIAVVWDTPEGVKIAFSNSEVADLQRFGMELLTESIIRTVAYSQPYIERLQEEQDE